MKINSLLHGVALFAATFIVMNPITASSDTPRTYDSPSFLPNDTQFCPWIYPLKYCYEAQSTYNFSIHMGFLNPDYYAYIDKDKGVVFLKGQEQTAQTDVPRYVLQLIDNTNSVSTLQILYGAGFFNIEKLKTLLPNTVSIADIKKGKSHNKWKNPKTHAKVLQLDNGKDKYFSTHGSLNLQTVGLTCKGNNSLRFTENSPVLYSYFLALANAAESGSGKGKFPDSKGTKYSSSTDLPPARVGNYMVSFYCGKADEFVGGVDSADADWPLYINPPIDKQHDKGVVNWYDAIIYDAAIQLRQGRSVNLYIAVYEAGEESTFLNNLWRFVAEGFNDLKTEDRHSDKTVLSRYMGNLNVQFLWQCQKIRKESSTTYQNLNSKSSLSFTDSNTGNSYKLESAKIWPLYDSDGNPANPTTPYAMHNKMMLMDVPGFESERKLYVTSSNLDYPKVGSGDLWQAATIIREYPGSEIWSGANASNPNLWNGYKKYFDMLWHNREGQPDSGQLNFYKKIAKEHLNGNMNWIETVPKAAFSKSVTPEEGIDAFFYPIPLKSE